jgi:hypothetical protein
MKYLQGSFQLPASTKTNEKKWDYSVLTRQEFKEKYQITDLEYDQLELN